MDYHIKNSQYNFLKVQRKIITPEVEQVFYKLLSRDISQNTAKALTRDLRDFVEWYVSVNGEVFEFSRFVARDVIDYKRFCQVQKKYAPKTINRRLSSIKSLCKMAQQAGVLEANPTESVKQVPLQPLAPKKLEKKDLRALLKEAEIRLAINKKYIRDALILELLSGAGLRVSELINLVPSDVQVSERKGTLKIRNGKGNKTRIVPINSTIRETLRKYVERWSEKPRFLLKGQRSEQLTAAGVFQIVREYAKKAGVKCSPHTLRHNFAYAYLETNPGDIVGLAQLLGHSNVNTTAIYTQHGMDDLQARVEMMI